MIEHILISVFQDDLFVIETLKLCNLLVSLRLVSQKWCEDFLVLILPLSLHPNRSIRESAAKYIYILATCGHTDRTQLKIGDQED